MHKSTLTLSAPGVLSFGFVLLTAFGIFLSSCFEETFESNVDVTFETSVDTLRFDTVFTSVGSITRSLKVYNPSDRNIIISSIALASGSASMFRLNIDGIPGNQANDIPILARDSLYIFVEVTVDPDQPVSVSPFIIEEGLVIQSGERQKRVILEAWGQNANYFPSRDARGQLIGLSCNQGELIWDDPKPYVVYGLLFIDSCTLIIPAGARIFVHGGLARVEETIFADGGLVFFPNGRLKSMGTAHQPVVLQGDRLEEGFDDVKGQWSGIRFLSNSKDHELNYTQIKNSIVGVRADSASSVTMNAVTIANTSNIGIIGIHAAIKADNSLIHSNGPQSIALVYGGNYLFRYCTIANYENQAPALYLDNFNCLTPDCSTAATFPLNAVFQNSIIMGSNNDEVEISDITAGGEPSFFQVIFDHTLVKIDEVKQSFTSEYCVGCIEHNDEPVFLDEFNDVYLLDTMSLARDQGIVLPDLRIDMNGQMRDLATPDIGCFEFVD